MPHEPANIVARGEPSRSALHVATLRALHQLLDEPIVLDDPIALPLLGAEREAALRADPFPYNDLIGRGLRAALVARSRFAEDELAAAVQRGVRQYVVLGAGLDTFAWRNPHPGLQVFEVDHPGTQAWKRECVAAAGLGEPPGLRYVPVDFERDRLAERLAAAGWRADAPSCFSWLGVTMYLTPDSVFATLGAIAALPPGSSLCLDFRVPREGLNPLERAVADLVEQRVAALGEPMITTFEPDDLVRRVRALGFAQAEVSGAEALNARYFARRKDGLRVGGVSRLLCART